ncbi:MAG: SDR family NAD(P)-dependent oxidoreductase [Alphaproteobacteria bacterium]|nr:MAG: SDR family NAD(P)-dependent oxidoreductase [Alphaproteobacteria bacterium]
MPQLEDFKGKLALVTGAGDGIGEMLARHLALCGMRVGVQDIRAEAATRVANEIGADAFPLVFDVSDRDAALAAAEKVGADHGPLNLLWINAGVGVGSPVLTGNPRNIEWGFGVNVLGVIWTAQAFVPLMKEADGPRHVGITASSATLRPPEGDFPLYATTKHATFAVGEALKGELAREGIATTLLNPGLLNTKIWDGAKARPDRFGGVRHMDPAIATRWNEAKLPEVMWPHIARTIEAGGGILTCQTEEGLVDAFDARAKTIRGGIVRV